MSCAHKDQPRETFSCRPATPPGTEDRIRLSNTVLLQSLFRATKPRHVRRSRIVLIQALICARKPRPGSVTADRMASAENSGPETQERCRVCLKDLPMTELVRISCGHLFCKQCLVSQFEYCVTREFRFPPRCCKGPISLSDRVLQALPNEVIERFYATQEELDTDVLERTYCHVARCSTFIQPRYFTGDRATCPKCAAMTCVVCKEAHSGSDIWVCDRPQGLEVPGFREMASGLGQEWKQCPFCLQMVERVSVCLDIRQWPRISMTRNL